MTGRALLVGELDQFEGRFSHAPLAIQAHHTHFHRSAILGGMVERLLCNPLEARLDFYRQSQPIAAASMELGIQEFKLEGANTLWLNPTEDQAATQPRIKLTRVE